MLTVFESREITLVVGGDALRRFGKEIQKSGKVVKAPSIGMDEKDFGIGAQILHDLDITKINLISNSKQKKRVGMIGYGLEIIDYIKY